MAWANFIAYIIITGITPGPNNIASMSSGSRQGFKKGLSFNFGILVGFTILMMLVTFFCSTLSALIPKVQPYLLVVGAGYMLYLAWHIFRAGTVSDSNQREFGFREGFILQFANIKTLIYGIVSMQVYIMPNYPNDMLVLSLFAFMLAFVGFLCTLTWSAFGSAMKVFFSKYSKATNTIMALLLVYCAVSLFF